MVMLLNFLRTLMAPVAILFTAAILIVMYGRDIGMKRPWDWVVAGILVLLAVVSFVVWWIVERRKERRFEDSVEQQAQEDMARASVTKRAEMEALMARWKEQYRLLRESRRGHPVLSTLPWFVIIGESGSGKSTLLKNSSLDFPVGDAKIAGIGGTKNCDWWFANEAIVLDTAGRYAFEVQNAPDREEWERFLSLLKRARKRKPINGLIVAVPTDSLLDKSEDELRGYAQHLRGKINDLMNRLGVVFPIYLVVTKADKVEGFVEFFGKYPAERIREVVGRTFVDARPAHCIEGAGKTLDDLYDRLCSMSLGFMEQNEPGAVSQPFLTFPEEYRSLAGQLKVFIEALLRPNRYMRNPVFRGLYITSGTQEGQTISKAFIEMAVNLKIEPGQLTSIFTEETPKRPFFVQDLWTKVIVEDGSRDLVRPLALGRWAEMKAALAKVVLPTALVAAVFLIWSFFSAAASKAQWGDLTKHVAEARPLLDGTQPPRDESIPVDLQSLLDVARYHRGSAQRSAILNLFLTRRDPAPGKFEQRFREAAERYVLGPTLARHKETLEGTPGAPAAYVKTLAAYLSYAAGASTGKTEPAERFEGLAEVWAQDQRMGVYAHKQDLADLLRSYIQMGGRSDGEVDWGRVAGRVQELVGRFAEADPVAQLRRVATENGSVVQSPYSAGLRTAYASLMGVVDTGAAGKDLPRGLFEQMAKDLEPVSSASVVKAPLGQLANVLERMAGSAGFGEKTGKPLQDLLAASPPGNCPTLDAANADSSGAVAQAIEDFGKQVDGAAKPLREGIGGINQTLAPADQIEVGVIADLIRLAKVDEYYASCSSGWFEPSGPLDVTTLQRVACPGSGGGGGGGGPTVYVESSGQGLFQCVYPLPSIGAGSGPPPCPNASTVQTFGSGLVGRIATLPDVALDRKTELRSRWDSVAGFLAHLAAGGVGGGPSNWNGRAAVDAITMESLAGVSLDALPDKLGQASNLKEIITTIKQHDPTAQLASFRYETYLTALAKLEQGIRAAQKDRTGLGWVHLTQGLLDDPDSPVELARSAATTAPSNSLRQAMARAPADALDKVLRAASTELDSFYSANLKERLEEFRSCFPFSDSTTSDCDAVKFNETFGPKGPIAKLEGLTAESPLEIGPQFHQILKAAVRIEKAYGQGGPDAAAFAVNAVVRQPLIRAEGGRKQERVIAFVDSGTLTLASQPVSFRKDGAPSTPLKLPVEAGASSNLILQLDDTKNPSWINPKEYIETKKMVYDPPAEFSGPWSFLRMLGNMKREGDAYTLTLPVYEDKKRKEVIASIVLAFQITGKSNAPSVAQPGFFNLPPPPKSVKE